MKLIMAGIREIEPVDGWRCYELTGDVTELEIEIGTQPE